MNITYFNNPSNISQAIDEPNFCEAYANMCRVMSSNQIRVEKGQQQPVLEFRKILLTRCQKEFEKAGSNEAKLQKLRVEYENAAEVSSNYGN